MDEGWGFLVIVAGLGAAALWGAFGRGSLSQAIRDLLWPE